MSKTKLPFGIKRPPQLSNTVTALVDVDDHINKSHVMVSTWWNGEGVTIEVDDFDPKNSQKIDLSWAQLDAVRLAIKAIRNRG